MANLLVDFFFLLAYNLVRKDNCLKILTFMKLAHYNIYFIICQQGVISMEETELQDVRTAIAKNLDRCNDLEILDLIYKLLITNITI